MRKLNQVALAEAAKAYSTKNYAQRFNKDPADPHVLMNVTYHWQDHLADAAIYVGAYLDVVTRSRTVQKHTSVGPSTMQGQTLHFLHPDPPDKQEALAMGSEFFGTDPQSWNHEDDGRVGASLFGNAVQVWSAFNAEAGRPSTVAAAAEAFAVDPRMVIEAVEAHCWMFLVGPQNDYSRLEIEHEGE